MVFFSSSPFATTTSQNVFLFFLCGKNIKRGKCIFFLSKNNKRKYNYSNYFAFIYWCFNLSGFICTFKFLVFIQSKPSQNGILFTGVKSIITPASLDSWSSSKWNLLIKHAYLHRRWCYDLYKHEKISCRWWYLQHVSLFHNCVINNFHIILITISNESKIQDTKIIKKKKQFALHTRNFFWNLWN